MFQEDKSSQWSWGGIVPGKSGKSSHPQRAEKKRGPLGVPGIERKKKDRVQTRSESKESGILDFKILPNPSGVPRSARGKRRETSCQRESPLTLENEVSILSLVPDGGKENHKTGGEGEIKETIIITFSKKVIFLPGGKE